MLNFSSSEEAFVFYRDLGWSVIAVRPNTKIPAFRNWTQNYFPNMNYNYISKNPSANLGILLGKIIDIEADTPESEQKLNLLLSGIHHMNYRSSRGSHHLFLNPFKKFRKVVIDGIEYRGEGHHSLLPPSTGPSGFNYKWADNSAEELTEMPEFFKKNLFKSISQAVKFETPRCGICGKECKVSAVRFNLEIQALVVIKTKWACVKCRKYDLREACRMIRKGKKVNSIDIKKRADEYRSLN